jgi:membrane protein
VLAQRLRTRPLLHALELAGRRFLADGMVDRAASLGYYGLLSLLPSLMIGAALVRLLGTEFSTVDDFADYLTDEGASTSLADTVQSVLTTALDSSAAGASTIGLVGLVTLIYGASRAFGAAGRALDTIRREPVAHFTVARRARDVAWTLLLLVLGVVAGFLAFIGRGVFEDLLDLLGLSDASALGWSVARWPLAAIVMLLAMQLVMWAAPSRRGRFHVLTPGAVVAVAVWVAASVGYAIYIGSVATYNATYGAFAALVILLLWIWLSALAFLYGCEFDAVIEERGGIRRVVGAGSSHPAGAPAPPPPELPAQPPPRSGAADR